MLFIQFFSFCPASERTFPAKNCFYFYPIKRLNPSERAYFSPVPSVTHFRLTFCLPGLGQKRPQLQDALLLDLHRFFIVFLDIAFH